MIRFLPRIYTFDYEYSKFNYRQSKTEKRILRFEENLLNKILIKLSAFDNPRLIPCKENKKIRSKWQV